MASKEVMEEIFDRKEKAKYGHCPGCDSRHHLHPAKDEKIFPSEEYKCSNCNLIFISRELIFK